jgi:hypothetical protein
MGIVIIFDLLHILGGRSKRQKCSFWVFFALVEGKSLEILSLSKKGQFLTFDALKKRSKIASEQLKYSF